MTFYEENTHHHHRGHGHAHHKGHGKGRRHLSNEHPMRGHGRERGYGEDGGLNHEREGFGPHGERPFAPGHGQGGYARHGAHGVGGRPGHGGRGFGGPEGFGPRGAGKRARRGNIRFAVLSLLADGPDNGFGLMKQIEERTGGTWKPSSGSMYPTLQRLVDEGLIQPSEGEGNAFELTDAGKTFVDEHAAEIGEAWERSEKRGEGNRELATAVHELMGAAHQVGQIATPEQRERATEIINSARKSLYGILAE